MKIYHTEKKVDYDALMVELESDGVTWRFGALPTKENNWKARTKNMCVAVSHQVAEYGSIDTYLKIYPDIPITKYKAKADEKMKFTKENVEKVIDEYFWQADLEPRGDLIAEIHNLDDTPEKVVVPKLVAEFYDSIRDDILYEKFKAFETATHEDVSKWYMDFKGRHNNNRANAQETIAKMDLYGYTIEPEQLYYIPLPDLETSDGIQQVLSKRENGTNYFASRPNEKLKQRFTKEELAQVPEIYKLYAKLIEEEAND